MMESVSMGLFVYKPAQTFQVSTTLPLYSLKANDIKDIVSKSINQTCFFSVTLSKNMLFKNTARKDSFVVVFCDTHSLNYLLWHVRTTVWPF